MFEPRVSWFERQSGIGEFCVWEAVITVSKLTRDTERRKTMGVPVQARGGFAEWLVSREIGEGDPLYIEGVLDIRKKPRGGFETFVKAKSGTDLTERGTQFRRGRVSLPLDEYRRLKAIEREHPDTVIPESVLEEVLSERHINPLVGYDSYRLTESDAQDEDAEP